MVESIDINLDDQFEQKVINPLNKRLVTLEDGLGKKEAKLDTLDRNIQMNHENYINKMNNYKNDVVAKINGCLESGKKIIKASVDNYGNYLLKRIITITAIAIIVILNFLGNYIWNIDNFEENSSNLLGDNLLLNSRISQILIVFLLYIFLIILLVFYSKWK